MPTTECKYRQPCSVFCFFVCRRQCGPQERLVYVMSKFKNQWGPTQYKSIVICCVYPPMQIQTVLFPSSSSFCFLFFVYRPQWGPQERFIYVTSKSNNEWGPTQYKSIVVCCVYPPTQVGNRTILFFSVGLFVRMQTSMGSPQETHSCDVNVQQPIWENDAAAQATHDAGAG